MGERSPQSSGPSPPPSRPTFFTNPVQESGWKLVHADVLRPPPLPLLLCATVGTGCQLIGMSCISIFFAMMGFLSPANRGESRCVVWPVCCVWVWPLTMVRLPLAAKVCV